MTEIAPPEFDSLMLFSFWALNAGQTRKALVYAQAALRQRQDDAVCQVLVTHLLLKEDNRSEAAHLLETIGKRDDMGALSWPVCILQALHAEKTGDLDEARRIIKAGLSPTDRRRSLQEQPGSPS